MSKAVVTEEEIEASEDLRAIGEYATALAMTQEMLSRAQDDGTKIRLLFDVLYCSTRIGEDDVTNHALQELEMLPEPEISQVFADLIRATSYVELGKPNEALVLIEENLQKGLLERVDQIWMYRYLVCKGRALTRQARCDGALAALTEAHRMYPVGPLEIEILIAQTNCLFAQDRYEEAYTAASEALKIGGGEMGALAMLYMAEIRTWQSRIAEALDLYIEIQKRLPCRLISEERFQKGMSYCVAYIERLRPQAKHN
jgi:tetratricopeptide (TPR) repeat protein